MKRKLIYFTALGPLILLLILSTIPNIHAFSDITIEDETGDVYLNQFNDIIPLELLVSSNDSEYAVELFDNLLDSYEDLDEEDYTDDDLWEDLDIEELRIKDEEDTIEIEFEIAKELNISKTQYILLMINCSEDNIIYAGMGFDERIPVFTYIINNEDEVIEYNIDEYEYNETLILSEDNKTITIILDSEDLGEDLNKYDLKLDLFFLTNTGGEGEPLAIDYVQYDKEPEEEEIIPNWLEDNLILIILLLIFIPLSIGLIIFLRKKKVSIKVSNRKPKSKSRRK